MRKDIIERKEEIIKYINENKPKYFICEKLKCQEGTLNRWLKKMKIDYVGKCNWSKGLKKPRIPIENYLKKKGPYIGSNYLKNKLFQYGLKEKRCEKCKKTKWLGEDIPLQLHHKDGDKWNNELTNLQILCGNCHSLTNNYAGKGKKNNKNIENFCKCGKKISNNAKKCKRCEKLTQKRKIEDRPSLEILLLDIKNMGFVQTGKKYNVSDNTIRKWIK